MPHRNLSRGFTLVEIAIVLTVIGLIAATMFVGGGALIQQADRKAAIKQVADIRTAARQFQEKFRFLPGDFPADLEIPNLSADCRTGGGGVGNGDGLIAFNAAPSESSCANDHLFNSGLYAQAEFISKYGSIRILSRAAAIARFGAAPANNVRDTVRNVILLENIPCFIATALDEAFDDGVLNNDTGLVANFSAACTNDNTQVWVAIAL